MENRVRALEPDDRMFKGFQLFECKVPAKFEMLPGYKASLKRISKIISTIDESLFEKQLLETKSTCSPLTSPSSSSNKISKTRSGKMNELDPNENYADKMIKSLVDIIKIASPQVIVPEITLTEEKRTSTCITYKVQCCYCSSETFLSVSTYLADGYLRVATGNFTRHVEKKHDEPGKRLTEVKVILTNL